MPTTPRLRLPAVIALLVTGLLAGSAGLRLVPSTSPSLDAVLTAGADMASERSDPSATKLRRPRPTDDVFGVALLSAAATLFGAAALLLTGSHRRPATPAPARAPALVHGRCTPRRAPPGS